MRVMKKQIYWKLKKKNTQNFGLGDKYGSVIPVNSFAEHMLVVIKMDDPFR